MYILGNKTSMKENMNKCATFMNKVGNVDHILTNIFE